MFEFKKVSMVYDLGKADSTYALRNVDFASETKGLTGIIGPSGSGKSSMLYLMSGLKTATSGQVLYRNQALEIMNVDARAKLRRQEFGFIFQRSYLLEYLNVLDNVLVTVNDASKPAREKAMHFLDRLGMSDYATRKPSQLSGGQRQRVTVARALMNDPRVIFADEPTSALDHKTAFEVMHFMSEIARERLVIVVTHDPTILSDADRVVRIMDGQLEALT